MADQTQLRILKEGVDAWNAWRQQAAATLIDLSGADLTKANLISANLTEADLTKANLSEADLAWADLSGANLTGCRIFGIVGVSAWKLKLEGTQQGGLVI